MAIQGRRSRSKDTEASSNLQDAPNKSKKPRLKPYEKKARDEALKNAAKAIFRSRIDNGGRPPHRKVDEELEKILKEELPNVSKADITNMERRLFSYGSSPKMIASKAIQRGFTEIPPNVEGLDHTPAELFRAVEQPPKKRPGRPKGSMNAAKAEYTSRVEECRVSIVNSYINARAMAKDKGTRCSPGALKDMMRQFALDMKVNISDLNQDMLRWQVDNKITHTVVRVGSKSPLQDLEKMFVSCIPFLTTKPDDR